MTGPEACPSPGPTSPGGGGPGAGLGAALTCPRPPLPRRPAHRSPCSAGARAFPATSALPVSGPLRDPGLGGGSQAGGESDRPQGIRVRLGLAYLLLSGRGRESARWTGSAAGVPRCAASRPGLSRLGQLVLDLAAMGSDSRPAPSASFLILPLPRIPAHPFCNVLRPGSAGLGRVSGNFSTPFQTSHHLDLARTYSDTLYLSPALGHPSHPAQSSARVPTGRGKCDP